MKRSIGQVKRTLARSAIAAVAGFASFAYAAEIAPPAEMHDWAIPWGQNVPGAMSARSLLRAPAGAGGFVIARDGHFYTGDRRIKFWGVNTCFTGNFPTHAQADEVANRLANFGVNCVRFHHMDMFAWPRGIFADESMRKLHPEALDRLDYFIAALKKQGIYADLNLHVSRSVARAGKWPEADQLPGMDKVVDLFHPDLIDAQKQYARDLLTHVNPYTKTAYASEPAVAMVEINNENTLFIWGASKTIAKLPERYQAELRKQWNEWLSKRYGSDDKLKAAWSAGAAPIGDDLLTGKWIVEAHDPARMTETATGQKHVLDITAVSDTTWHLQFQEQGLSIAKDAAYTLTFDASADKPRNIDVSVGQAHEPWENLGFAQTLALTTKPQSFTFTFVGSAGDANARLSFIVGGAVGKVTLENIRLRKGGVEGLAEGESLARGSVALNRPGAVTTKARREDWLRFLQETDERYFVGMQKFLKDELNVRAPITGSIGWSMAGTYTQSKLDFVDGHAYWDHPSFPGKAWDGENWLIHNKPMVDRPEAAAFWGLAAGRVQGKPFTVTEYNHAAPNEWSAECIPMIAAYAAAQDWDGVFLFAYSHNDQFKKDHVDGFFDIEGDPAKLAQMPMGARLFLGGVKPLANELSIAFPESEILAEGSLDDHDAWHTIRTTRKLAWPSLLTRRVSLNFAATPADDPVQAAGPSTLNWTTGGAPGTGRFTLADEFGIAFTGFRSDDPVKVGAVEIRRMETPFASFMLAAADPSEPIATSKRLLLSAVGRTANHDMGWNKDRTTVGGRWGKGPVQIEPVRALIAIDGAWRVRPLNAQGDPGEELRETIENGKTVVQLGTPATVWYELIRK